MKAAKTGERPRRIGIDASAMLIARKNGYENYTTSLLLHMSKLRSELGGLEIFLYFHAGNPLADPRLLDEYLPHFAGFHCRVYRFSRLYGRVLPVMAFNDRLDWLHLPVYLWSRWYPCRVGVTLHDACPVRLRRQGIEGAGALDEARDRQALNLGAAFIAVSESTKQDMVEFYRVAPEKIRVVHHGVDPYFKPSPEDADRVRRRYDLDRYILVVNALQVNKNYERLLQAFIKLRQQYGVSERLVIVGRDGIGADRLHSFIKQLDLGQALCYLGYVPREDLRGLYSGAQLVVNPSLCEGFGLTLLEAMACGAVVAASNTTALPEVAGEAALLFDPYDVDAIADSLYRGLADSGLRMKLKEAGFSRASQFSWDQAARETLRIYRDWSGQ